VSFKGGEEKHESHASSERVEKHIRRKRSAKETAKLEILWKDRELRANIDRNTEAYRVREKESVVRKSGEKGHLLKSKFAKLQNRISGAEVEERLRVRATRSEWRDRALTGSCADFNQ